MEARSKRIRKATLALIGTIIGAGLFGLPALFSIVGFWPGTLLFWFLACIVLLTHLYYAEIILHFKKRMRIAGYAGEILGKWGFVVMAVAYPLQVIGINLIYIILGGTFLASLAHLIGLGGPTIIWQLIFWLIGAGTVLLGLSFLARFESVATWLLILTILVVVGISMRHVDLQMMTAGNWNRLFIPFGVFLFSLSGLSVIGEVVDISERKKSDVRMAVIFGTLLAALFSWLFGVGLFLAARGTIGTDPADLLRVLPPIWQWMIPFLGLLAVITSYITSADDLKETLRLDFRMREHLAWVIALFVPLLFFFSHQDYFSTVDFVGTVFGGLNALFIIFMAVKLFYGKRRAPAIWNLMSSVILLLVFMVGILHRLLYWNIL